MAEQDPQKKEIEIKRIHADELNVKEIEIDPRKETIIVIDHEAWNLSS